MTSTEKRNIKPSVLLVLFHLNSYFHSHEADENFKPILIESSPCGDPYNVFG